MVLDHESLQAYHLADESIASMYQPARQNTFRCLIDFSGANLVYAGDPSGRSLVHKNSQEIIDFSVVSFKPPHFQQSEIPIKRGNSTIYFAGTPEWQTNTLKINDFIGADGKSILEAWQALSYDVNNDTIPDSVNYKLNATVLEYSPDHKLVNSWKIYGCWVKGLDEDEYNNENNGKKTVTATIRYDRAIPDKSVSVI